MNRIIAADMGGTKTGFAFYESHSNSREPLDKLTLDNRDFPSPAKLLMALPKEMRGKDCLLVMGVAGPIYKQSVKLTNIDWEFSAQSLRDEVGFGRVMLLNDLEASAEAIEILREDELWTLLEGEPEIGGSIALIAPGTGLGEAYISEKLGVRIAHATEGGHADFAPKSEEQSGLLDYLSQEFGHVSVERICSGIGIPNVYRFLQMSISESELHAQELAASNDLPARIFSHAGQDDSSCQICSEVLRIFIEVLAAEAGNLVLKTGATGGLYIGGGILPKIRNAFNLQLFRKYFLAKGRRKEYMERIPVRMILNSQSPLLGAAQHAFKQLKT